MSRPRRSVGNPPMASVSRDAVSSPLAPQSLRFSVKLPASKLRQAIGEPSSRPGLSINVNSRDPFLGGEILDGKRSRNVKKSYVVESESDEDDDAEMEDADNDDAEGESLDEDDEDTDADADADADGDIDMDIPPPAPLIKTAKSNSSVIVVKPSGKSDGKTVEQKEVSDDELSELDSDIEDEEEEMQMGNDEDAEGEDEEIEVEDDGDEEDEEELDSDADTPAGGSRGSSPDLTKMTKRQRAKIEDGDSGYLMALPDEVQVKKHLTAEEHAMRRAEMARRRKNLSEKKNEEEKMETINKLLKKQAPKTNARRKELNGQMNEDGTVNESFGKPNPAFVRYISNKGGNSISIPEEYMAAPVGAIFRTGGVGAGLGGKLIQEV